MELSALRNRQQPTNKKITSTYYYLHIHCIPRLTISDLAHILLPAVDDDWNKVRAQLDGPYLHKYAGLYLSAYIFTR